MHIRSQTGPPSVAYTNVWFDQLVEIPEASILFAQGRILWEIAARVGAVGQQGRLFEAAVGLLCYH
jgi:hypothetical protein